MTCVVPPIQPASVDFLTGSAIRLAVFLAIVQCALVGSVSQGGVVLLDIRNADFEGGTLPGDGSFFNNIPQNANPIQDWSDQRDDYVPVEGTTGLFNPSMADIIASNEPAPPSDDVVAFLHLNGGFLLQDLLNPGGGGFLALKVGDQISVSVFAHDRSEVDPTLHVGIRALDNSHLAVAQSMAVTNDDGYSELTFDFTMHTAAAEAFLIFSKPAGLGQINLDDVSASFTAAVPEPSTFALLGIGCVGFGVSGVRRRKAAAVV